MPNTKVYAALNLKKILLAPFKIDRFKVRPHDVQVEILYLWCLVTAIFTRQEVNGGDKIYPMVLGQ